MRRPASCAILVIFGPAFLPLTLGGRRHPQHRDVLAQRRHRLRVLRHFEIAADDGEIRLAFGQRLRACAGAVGLQRAEANLTARLVVQRLRQRLDDPDVVAVGRPDRDPQGHRPHRKVIAGGQRPDDGENAGQHDECQPSPRRTRRRTLDEVGLGHRSRKQPFDVRFHHAYASTSPIVANFLTSRGDISVMVTSGHRTRFRPYFRHGSHPWPQVLG